MRLMEAREYRGQEIRIYLLLPDEARVARTRPALGVQIVGVGPPRWSVLPGVSRCDDALRWGREVIDRAQVRAGRRRHATTTPVG